MWTWGKIWVVQRQNDNFSLIAHMSIKILCFWCILFLWKLQLFRAMNTNWSKRGFKHSVFDYFLKFWSDKFESICKTYLNTYNIQHNFFIQNTIFESLWLTLSIFEMKRSGGTSLFKFTISCTYLLNELWSEPFLRINFKVNYIEYSSI